ncbi:hypothetical protein GLOIN_2v1771334 [Rhizophagus irregularis DAOM 181602=DAOM 197198]|uniref:Uncharacterized protein n=2 Tax=Rhizophagus irregularis TaxID=588596 RepID=A0A2P4QA11_RHIID|nr:hypothetical protein GLOIN_2v1771334 [Rhizophagus irregularis DAOM 181602=DAOM 197198]POG74489.1 hypothetical protein GLOIN_2v1771334 [Rhizophagus irregularis DAOM 181602=DAOM 197198]|eukprot:XP_025181355.1 hypothetical protein GLOIN_2v1771334 [Rhizophagus irregularis DAOM 181602=DAOM 197198]
MKPSDAITSVASPASSNTTQLWTVKYRKNLEKRSDSWNFLDYGMSFAEIATKEIFRDEYRLHRDRLKNRGGLFLEQLIEPYTNRMMKWSHFLAKNNLCKGPEPLWYKKLSEMVIDVEEDDRVVKHITSFQEILTRENNTKERIIAYIKTKRSRSKNYDEVGKHLIVHEELENENEKFNSPFLIATMTKGRKIENSGDESIVKPYMTSENIEAQNESVIESNIKEVKEMDANVMLIDDNKMDSMDNKRIRGFIGKEVIVNVGADIQKGRELCLNGFFGNELIPKNKIRTDLNIIEWLYSYCKMGSARRELDDKLYIYLNFINTLLELKNVKMLVKDDKAEIQKEIQDGKFALRWNYIPIEGAFRSWLKELSFNNTKIDIMLLDYVRDCFIESDGRNITIDWSASFKLINNEITTSKNVTNRDDATTRSFRVKNFLKILPTLQSVMGKESVGIDEILNNDGGVCNGEEKVRFKERIIDLAENCSLITKTEKLIYEIKRGIVNKKWWTLCKIKGQHELQFRIFDEFMRKYSNKFGLTGVMIRLN